MEECRDLSRIGNCSRGQPPSTRGEPLLILSQRQFSSRSLADVTKGAFFHHFDSKETLVKELMQMLLTRLDQQFDRLMAEEENSDGCFTRAYIRAAFSEGAAERKVWGALLSLLASKDQVGSVWDAWLSERLKRHSKTDSRIGLRVVRLAADGVWLERIMNAKSKNLRGVEESLIEMTRIR